MANVEEVRINEPRLFSLKDSAEEAKHLTPDQLVVAVGDQEDLLRTAVLLGCHAEVGHRPLLYLVLDDGVARRGQTGLVAGEVLLDLIAGAVGAGVVDEDDVVVGVVLHEHGADVFDVEVVLGVVVARNDNTEGQFGVLTDVVLSFIVLLFKESEGRHFIEILIFELE